MPKEIICPDCGGKGSLPCSEVSLGKTCVTCGGYGFLERIVTDQSYFIWWLNQLDVELIDLIDTKFPEYIQQELDSMNGRPLRGRLWVNPKLSGSPDTMLSDDPWPDTDLADTLGKHYGGLVIKEEDAYYVLGYPGLLTDFYLNPISSFGK